MAELTYIPQANEVQIFLGAHEAGFPVMLTGPTGCGKTRFVEVMAQRLGRPVITVACHEDLTASDLVGRYLLEAGQTVWVDGPLTRAVRQGAICYLDEIVESRQDTTVVIHPLADHRRTMTIERTGETITPAQGFQLVVSYNPGYQSVLKDLKASTRQRMVAIPMDYPVPDVELEILQAEVEVPRGIARRLVDLAAAIRTAPPAGVREVASTRTLVTAARLYVLGVDLRDAVRAAMADALTDDKGAASALYELVDAYVGEDVLGVGEDPLVRR